MPRPTRNIESVLVTGGAGYVGAVLVPRLLAEGYRVRVLDLFLFGDEVLDRVKDHPALEVIRGDLRDRDVIEQAMRGRDAVIHLACVSNDPSFELDPTLGKSINYDAFPPLVCAAREAGVKRFVYASSSSVYGVKREANVTEELSLEPLTDYSTYKALCEQILMASRAPGFSTLIVRPATVCGYSPRQRLDLVVNVMTLKAVTGRLIPVHGGPQMRPNIHIDDMADFYVQSLRWSEEKIDGKIYNVGCDNRSLWDIAKAVRFMVGADVRIETIPTNDPRSYHVSSEKVYRELGFLPRRSIEDAIRDVARAISLGRIPNPLYHDHYYNVRTMQKWCAQHAERVRSRRAIAA